MPARALTLNFEVSDLNKRNGKIYFYKIEEKQ
jgi:hypothetical protein